MFYLINIQIGACKFPSRFTMTIIVLFACKPINMFVKTYGKLKFTKARRLEEGIILKQKKNRFHLPTTF